MSPDDQKRVLLSHGCMGICALTERLLNLPPPRNSLLKLSRSRKILTDAPLHPMGCRMEQRCGDCTACMDICPQNAFTGKIFSEAEPREARFDAAACDGYFREKEKKKSVAVCGLFLYICPYGRKSVPGNHQKPK